MRRALAVLALLFAAACPGPRPTPTPVPGSEVPSSVAPGTSLRVLSMASTPASSTTGGAWQFPEGTRTFDLTVVLEGSGTFDVLVEIVRAPGGESVHNDSQRHTLNGRLELTFGKLGMPDSGGYTMTLEVKGPGVRQRSQVTLRN